MDHPRGCGEHVASTLLCRPRKGSSPRMRGAQAQKLAERESVGIIPADAGSTDWQAWVLDDDEDHPRGCGEHQPIPDWDATLGGSSPRMRGAPCRQEHEPRIVRIIPADAGSTPACSCASCPSKDHPRGCGEHNLLEAWQRYSRDHPRGCGEHLLDSAHPLPWPGSSPRMRGAHRRFPGADGTLRIIPADAGSTEHASFSIDQQSDHPRGCGEHVDQLRVPC